MPILYNCRHSGDQYRITKFDSDMNPQGSYLLSLEECECPAGVRPTCRHRQMLPKFIARSHVGDEWMFDFDRGGWVQMGEKFIHTILPEGAEVHQNEYVVGPGNTEEPTTYVRSRRALPEGVTAIVLDHPDKVVDVHNAIAEAVGEPEIRLEPPAPTHIPRRF